MWQTDLSPKAQQLIDRLAAIDYENPQICGQRIQDALSQHLKALNLPERPVNIYQSVDEGCSNIGLDAFDAGWHEAYQAVSKATLYAAWNAEKSNAGYRYYAVFDAARDSVRDSVRTAAWETQFDYYDWLRHCYEEQWLPPSPFKRITEQAGQDAAKAVVCVNSTTSSPQHDQFCAVWMPFVDALEAGLFWFWVAPKEVMVLTLPVMRIQDNQLHADDGQPALVWSDGAEYYFWRGTHVSSEEAIFSNKYGDVSECWKSEWLLEESNAEFRRLLIEGLGYDRIVQELEAVELDTWREYSLLKIQANIDVEPIHLLKMTCPSTNHIHVLRVPPYLTSAREAIRWVNWDVDPEAFAVET